MAVVAMTHSGLFAHLAARFGPNPEILAAEALAYLLTLIQLYHVTTPRSILERAIGRRLPDR